MKNLEVSREDLIRLHQLAAVYHEVGGKVAMMQKKIADAEKEISELLESLEQIKKEEENLYAQISEKHGVTRSEAVTSAITALLDGK
jgi:hypothetical protein